MGNAEHSVKNARIQTWLSALPSGSQPKPWLTLTVKLNQARQLLRDEQWENISVTRLTFQYIYLSWEFGIWGVHPAPAHTAFLKSWTRSCRGITPSPTVRFLKSYCKGSSSCIRRLWYLFPGIISSALPSEVAEPGEAGNLLSQVFRSFVCWG